MDQTSPTKRASQLIRLIQLDLILTIFLELLISLSSGSGILSKIQLPRLVLSILLLGAAIGLIFTKHSSAIAGLEQKLSSFAKKKILQFIPILVFGIFSVSLLLTFKQNIIFNLFPLLICAWLMGGQFLLLYQERTIEHHSDFIQPRSSKILAFASILGIYLFLAIPSRLAGIFDGIPWGTTPEFIFAAILIPLSIIFGWRLYAKRAVFITILVLVILRAIVAVSMPETGLEVRTYQSADNLLTENWHRSYATALGYPYSDVMKAPYQNMYEFPADWITRQVLVTNPRPLIGLSIHGYARLKPGESLVFLTSGLNDGEIILTDGTESFSAPVVDAGSQALNNIKAPNTTQNLFSISGTLVFKNDSAYQFAPIILQADKTTRSAFEKNNLWLSDSTFQQSESLVTAMSWLVWLQNISLAGLVLACLLIGITMAVRYNHVNSLEIYWGASGALLLLVIAKLWDTLSLFMGKNHLAETLQYSAIFLVFYTTSILLIARFRSADSSHLAKGFLLSSGLIVLSLMLMLYFDTFRQFTVYSTLDDAYEYQYFARNIFVNRDFMLLETPPRAYKFLFPYIVGSLHLVFGQSSSAQVFLNTWCSLLTAMLMILIAKTDGVRDSISQATGGLLVLLLLGNYSFFYYHFGLIEPVGVLCMVGFFYFAQRKSIFGMILTGIITILIRLDYAGAVMAGLLLAYEPIRGSFTQGWGQVLTWLKSHWKKAGMQAALLVLPAAGIIATYNLLTKSYLLNASDTTHTGLASIAEGLMRVTIGGNAAEMKTLFADSPLLTTFTTLILLTGTLTGLTALVWRSWKFRFIDLRWSLVILGLLSVYFVVRPTGYPPRFSTAMLPLAILMLAFLFDKIWGTTPQV